MPLEEFIFTISGVRGIYGKTLNIENTEKIALAYGLWLQNNEKLVIIGRDTRPSGENLEKAVVRGLNYAQCRIINLGVCPTPIIIYTKNRLKIPGGIIISGSHNPPEWNGIKLLSIKTFLSNSEVNQISNILYNDQLIPQIQNKSFETNLIKEIDPIKDYIEAINKEINFKLIKARNSLKVVLDTGAGAGKIVTPKILQKMGCKTQLINNDFKKNKFPREIEPIEKNLTELINIILEGDFDVGFAQDCDADRIAIIGDDGTCYPEDIGLAIIADYYFKQYYHANRQVIFVTNLASSLIFEALAEKYGSQIIRTPVGERNLAEKMEDLIKIHGKNSVIFGGEGSCGGVMIPHFNNTRDGIFAAAKIIEILVNTHEKISDLVSKLPKFYAFREYINIENKNLNKIISQLKEQLISDGENVKQIDLDLRFGQEHDWFVLIHPSNTEPIIRIISEANNKNLAKKKLDVTSKRVKSLVSNL
jgi:phosphomannomutase